MLVLLIAGIAIALTAVGTAAAVNVAASRQHGGDAIFWYGFVGVTALIVEVVWLAVAEPWLAAVGVGIAAACTGASSWWLARNYRRRRADLRQSLTDARWRELEKRHDVVVSRWTAYELDPALAIDHPELTDARVPEVAAVIRALKRATRARNRRADRGAYAQSVEDLEVAFNTAEGGISLGS